MAENPNAPFSTRLSPEARADLKAFANEKGMKESDAGRMFILEKLAEWKAGGTKSVPELRKLFALTIAALSDKIEIEDANDLIEEHLNPTVPS
jgi:hypothetical protein